MLPTMGFDDTEGRIPGVGRYALVCFCDIVGRIRFRLSPGGSRPRVARVRLAGK